MKLLIDERLKLNFIKRNRSKKTEQTVNNNMMNDDTETKRQKTQTLTDD